MMKASRPGMYEYQYKAVFDYALGQYGPQGPAFPSIISAGRNNFCIHYYASALRHQAIVLQPETDAPLLMVDPDVHTEHHARCDEPRPVKKLFLTIPANCFAISQNQK